ncbi:sensor histidine kinase [Geobacter sp. OR-1]|uniref:sensor histidine kinase n=1 Tax=Geobacter sp. OR-1 TaxID=1266765 RepID=UPI001ED987FD|nr:sensor histidine kinase [Geobacter sp. OR-1]
MSNIIESGFSDVIRSLQSIPDFAGLLLVDQNAKAVYAVDEKRGVDQKLADTVSTGVGASLLSAGAKEIHVYAPIMHENICIGAARLALSLAGEQERLARSQRLLMAYFVLDFLLLLGIGYVFLRRSVVAPMRGLLAAIDRVAKGDYEQTVHVPGSAEIADLSDSFNAMLAKLRNNRAEVKQHVSSLEEVNLKLQEAREEAIRSERLASVGLLAAGTAHEIGTPLAAIIGYSAILSDELTAEPDKRDYSRRIEQEASRIDRIVRDLLDYARPPRCEFTYEEVAPLIEETVSLLDGQGVFKNISVSVVSDSFLPEPYIDRHQFQQVLINLLLNARDAMPGGGTIEVNAGLAGEINWGSAQIIVGRSLGRRKDDFRSAFQAGFSGETSSKALRIDIRDSGSGIPCENMERIFDPFFTTKEPGKGTGLGLSIAARIIDSFGGRIIVTSDPGLGSCFSILLPVAESGGSDQNENP